MVVTLPDSVMGRARIVSIPILAPEGSGKETAMTDHSLADVRELAQQLRVDSIRCSTAAGSGHPTSSMSAADVMAVLLARHFRYDWQHPDNPANDHLIFSKGHASPLLYSMFKAAGVLSTTS